MSTATTPPPGNAHLPTRKRKSPSLKDISTSFPLPSKGEDHHSGKEEAKEEVINFQPLNKKPKFEFQPSALAKSLPGFLEAMRRGNESLKLEEGGAGGFEILDQEEDGSESGSDDDELDEAMDGEGLAGKGPELRKRQKRYIEMELGLGVLEQKREGEEQESDSESGSSELDGESNVSHDSVDGSGRVVRRDAEMSSESESSSDEEMGEDG